MINRIVKEIKDPKNMFRPLKGLEKIDYLMLLKDKQDNYFNEEINSIFDRWNKKYGNNIILFDEDNTNKNNIYAIAQEVKYDLHKVEIDDDKIINSLVAFLYKNQSTRKKKLLWYIYGEQLYNNIVDNLKDVNDNICCQCGKRVKEELIRGKCFNCRQEEIKTLNGKKLIKCVDCGEDVIVSSRSRSIRCDRCSKIERQRIEREKKSKQRKKVPPLH